MRAALADHERPQLQILKIGLMFTVVIPVPRSNGSLADQGLVLQTVELKEQLEGVRKAIQKLPESQRKLLSMKVIEGLDYSEIEKRTGLGGLNIRVQVSLARKRLKTQHL